MSFHSIWLDVQWEFITSFTRQCWAVDTRLLVKFGEVSSSSVSGQCMHTVSTAHTHMHRNTQDEGWLFASLQMKRAGLIHPWRVMLSHHLSDNGQLAYQQLWSSSLTERENMPIVSKCMHCWVISGENEALFHIPLALTRWFLFSFFSWGESVASNLSAIQNGLKAIGKSYFTTLISSDCVYFINCSDTKWFRNMNCTITLSHYYSGKNELGYSWNLI